MPRSKATSTPDRQFPSGSIRYTFLGGKGGVGKTTCAAAMAIAAARRGARTLVVSTDPAPSLADALRQPLGPAPRAIKGVARLDAVELDATQALDRWLRTRRGTLEEIALRGTWLDRDDVSRLLRLSLPGIDEIAALLQLAALGRGAAYDRIFVDTAPTGHLLRMLEMPAVLQGLARVFDHMQARHRIVVGALRGGWTPDAADGLIGEIAAAAEDVRGLLADPSRARFWWATLAETMAVEETSDAIRWLRAHGMALEGIIANRVTAPPPRPCRWCDARRTFEGRALSALRRRAGTRVRVALVPAARAEPRGIRTLAGIGALLEAPPAAIAAPCRSTARAAVVLPARGRVADAAVTPPDARLVMFGGKGGVGKTTCAAAAAIGAALAWPERRVLLLSSDPAHSLGDVLGMRCSDTPRRIPGGPANLLVRELDAGAGLDRLRARFAAAVDDLFARMSGGSAAAESATTHDHRVISDLIELAPPGVDELVAIIEVTDTFTAVQAPASFDLVIVDTAPTGHALRLLEMPAMVHDWVKALMAILLKYQPILGMGDLGTVLVRLSQGLGRLRAIMADHGRTRFVAVTRPAALPRAETLRLLRRLRAVSIASPLVLVNAVGTGTCRRCTADRAAQMKEMALLIRTLPRQRQHRRTVLVAPAEMPPPHGWRSLRRWRSRWQPRA